MNKSVYRSYKHHIDEFCSEEIEFQSYGNRHISWDSGFTFWCRVINEALQKLKNFSYMNIGYPFERSVTNFLHWKIVTNILTLSRQWIHQHTLVTNIIVAGPIRASFSCQSLWNNFLYKNNVSIKIWMILKLMKEILYDVKIWIEHVVTKWNDHFHWKCSSFNGYVSTINCTIDRYSSK